MYFWQVASQICFTPSVLQPKTGSEILVCIYYVIVNNLLFSRLFHFQIHENWMEPNYSHLHNISVSLTINKTEILTWIVSNCRTQSRRELFVQKLEKYFPVKVFGKCGKTSIPKAPGVNRESKFRLWKICFWLIWEIFQVVGWAAHSVSLV